MVNLTKRKYEISVKLEILYKTLSETEEWRDVASSPRAKAGYELDISITKNDIKKREAELRDIENEIELAEERNRKMMIRREDSLWEDARELDTQGAYDNYLQEYPQGRFVNLAYKRISLLENRRPFKPATDTNWFAYMMILFAFAIAGIFGYIERDRLANFMLPKNLKRKLSFPIPLKNIFLVAF